MVARESSVGTSDEYSQQQFDIKVETPLGDKEFFLLRGSPVYAPTSRGWRKGFLTNPGRFMKVDDERISGYQGWVTQHTIALYFNNRHWTVEANVMVGAPTSMARKSYPKK